MIYAARLRDRHALWGSKFGSWLLVSRPVRFLLGSRLTLFRKHRLIYLWYLSKIFGLWIVASYLALYPNIFISNFKGLEFSVGPRDDVINCMWLSRRLSTVNMNLPLMISCLNFLGCKILHRFHLGFFICRWWIELIWRSNVVIIFAWKYGGDVISLHLTMSLRFGNCISVFQLVYDILIFKISFKDSQLVFPTSWNACFVGGSDG